MIEILQEILDRKYKEFCVLNDGYAFENGKIEHLRILYNDCVALNRTIKILNEDKNARREEGEIKP